MLRNDVWHGGLCGGEGNIRVHGSIFDSVAIETTHRLTSPNSSDLASFKRTHNFIYNKKGTSVEYNNAIDFLG